MDTNARQRRLLQLAAVLTVAIALVVVAVLVSGGGEDADDRAASVEQADGAIPGQRESAEMLAGIPQDGIYLGQPNAPVRVVEFADLQCPVCREYTLTTLPVLVQDYVRSGKVRMELRDWAFLGEDSVEAGRYASAAAEQNKLWNFIDVLYFNQGEENSGYVTPEFLRRIGKAAGLDTAAADRFAATPESEQPLRDADALARRLGLQGTPTILVGKQGGELSQVQANPGDVDAFKQAIDGVLGQA